MFYAKNRCPVCTAKCKHHYCSWTCKTAHRLGKTRAEQIKAEMDNRPWVGKLLWSHSHEPSLLFD